MIPKEKAVAGGDRMGSRFPITWREALLPQCFSGEAAWKLQASGQDEGDGGAVVPKREHVPPVDAHGQTASFGNGHDQPGVFGSQARHIDDLPDHVEVGVRPPRSFKRTILGGVGRVTAVRCGRDDNSRRVYSTRDASWGEPECH